MRSNPVSSSFGGAGDGTGSTGGGAGDRAGGFGGGVSGWVPGRGVNGPLGSTAWLVRTLCDAAAELAGMAAPQVGAAALEEAEALIDVKGLVALAAEARIGVVESRGAAKAAGHAGVPAWLRARSGGRMARHAAGVARRNAVQFQRLPRVVAALLEGLISHDMATAIAAAVSCLGKEVDVTDTEEILLRLALDEKGSPEKVALVGRHLRRVLDPDGSLDDEDKAYGNRYLATMVDDKGGMTGRFYLPPEAAARLQQLLDKYAQLRDAADDRTKTQRQADALIATLNEKVAAQILVLVNAESLPDSHPAHRPAEQDSGEPAPSADGTVAGSRGAGAQGTNGGRRSASDDGVSVPSAGGEGEGDRGSASSESDYPGPGDDEWCGPLDEQAQEQVRVALANLGHSEVPPPDRLPCDACGRPANRLTPGLLMPTGHPLPAKHVRRLLHTSLLFRVVVDARARVVDTSYGVRFVPDWIRRLVLTQYDTCAYNDCPIEATFCDMDHVFDWAYFNRTKPDEIVPACGHHNRDRAADPGKYRLERLPDGRWHFSSTRTRG